MKPPANTMPDPSGGPHEQDETRIDLRWYQRQWRKYPMITILILAGGATIGAALRYYITLWGAAQFGLAFPYGTLLINASGSFVLGLFLTLAAQRGIATEWRLLVATGFCGAYTTFSTFAYDTIGLLDDGKYLAGALNVFGSVGLGLAAVMLGIAVARAL